MKKYVLGIIFNSLCQYVVLLKKNKPEWQAGRYNFPGGKIEQEGYRESAFDAIVREVKEKTGLYISTDKWCNIGRLENESLNYNVEIFATILSSKGLPKLISEINEPAIWVNLNHVKSLNIISHVNFFIEYSLFYFVGENDERILYSIFKYCNNYLY